MVRTQIQLTEAQAEALRRVAAHEGRSMAEVVRDAVDAWLAAREASSPADRKRRLLDALGRFRSGRSDVSEQHDAHLDDAFST